MTRSLFVAPLAAALLAGCFSSRDTAAPVDDDLCASSAANIVKIRDFAFSPADLRVAPGTTVTWVNCDAVQHTSTSDGAGWDSGLLSRDQTFRRTFTAAGTFDYHCAPHPFMQARIRVE